MKTPSDRPETISPPDARAASLAGRGSTGGGILFWLLIRLARLAWRIIR